MSKKNNTLELTANDFTGAVQPLINELFTQKIHQKPVSDITDANGHYYVDLVQEGGGILGIALLGYTYVLEKMGIRFLNLGGTSAGAINTLLLAASGYMDQPKTEEKLLPILANADFNTFVDGDGDAKDFVEVLINEAGLFKGIWKGIQVLDNFRDRWGLNPGDVFKEWLKKIIKGWGITTTQDLYKLRKPLNTQLLKRGEPFVIDDVQKRHNRIVIIAADITTETKVQFPDMARFYWHEPAFINPAEYVRASISIPFFFEPYTVKDLPNNPDIKLEWEQKLKYAGPIPDNVYFVDGGIMSNFPIDLFHIQGVPTAPTFGVKLGSDRRNPRNITHLLNYTGAIFDASRHTLDYDFMLRNNDYKEIVTYINVDGFHWLNFQLSPQQRIELFKRGALAAAEFLKKFDWEAYKKIRELPSANHPYNF